MYVDQKNMLNLNKILMKVEFIEKIKILLSKAGLRELRRLELTPGNLYPAVNCQPSYRGAALSTERLCILPYVTLDFCKP